jgi:hypothetical protein
MFTLKKIINYFVKRYRIVYENQGYNSRFAPQKRVLCFWFNIGFVSPPDVWEYEKRHEYTELKTRFVIKKQWFQHIEHAQLVNMNDENQSKKVKYVYA